MVALHAGPLGSSQTRWQVSRQRDESKQAISLSSGIKNGFSPLRWHSEMLLSLLFFTFNPRAHSPKSFFGYADRLQA